MLTPRQELILGKVVEVYLHDGQPVASKTIAADPALECGPSTVRNELSVLEEHGLLAHPHTSAGRVPTDAGHRYVVDRVLAHRELVPAVRPHLQIMRREVEEAMRVTSETLSQVTDLLAVVSAPSINAATIRHVEVLALQPQVVMVVIITSTGGVSKLLTTFDAPVDPGLVSWAGEYLNERLAGMGLGARMLSQRLNDPGLGASERAFLSRVGPALADLAAADEDMLYVEGAARLFAGPGLHDVAQVNALMELLERRVALLSVLRHALDEPDVYVRIGGENEHPALQPLALVAAGYGLAARPLGTVSVIGPVRMDYPSVIATVRDVARELSSFIQDAYAD
jgi:heat-inducible transcriptional repressor